MQTIEISRWGGAEVLAVVEHPAPEPDAGEVTIDVSHAAVGLADVLMRRGAFGGEPPLIPGLEVAGTVRALGPGVTQLQVGQPVVTMSRPTAGGYAQVSVAGAGVTVPLEPDDDRAVAVSVVPNATTAFLALRTVAQLAAGERLVVHGALGALGSVVAQVGRHLGAGHVTGTVRRAAQVDAALAAGFDDAIVDTEYVEHAGEASADVVVDPVGGPLRAASVRALAPLGRLVCVGNASGADDVQIGGNELWLSSGAVLGLNAGGLLAQRPDVGREAAQDALALLRGGGLSADVTTLPLAAAADAHRQLEGGDVRGRLVLTVDPTEGTT